METLSSKCASAGLRLGRAVPQRSLPIAREAGRNRPSGGGGTGREYKRHDACFQCDADKNSPRCFSCLVCTEAGGSIEIVSLPDLGIKGNSHFAMMEKNNTEVAEVVHKWLAGKGLVD
jgi:hypothetical protein